MVAATGVLVECKHCMFYFQQPAAKYWHTACQYVGFTLILGSVSSVQFRGETKIPDVGDILIFH